MNKLVSNAWVWFAVWCVALYFVTQLFFGWAVQWAVGAQAQDPAYTAQGSDLTTLWAKDSYGVTATKAVLTHTEAPQAILYYETPQLSPGLVRVQ